MTAMDWHPTEKKLRQFAWAWLVFLTVIWPLIALLRSHGRAAGIAAIVGIAGWGLGLIRPALLHWPFVILSLITWPIGQIVGRLALLVVFYLVITPMGLVQRLAGRDPMGRRFDASASTYWRARKSPEASRYLRQS